MENSRVALVSYRKGEGDLKSLWQSACKDIAAHVGSTRASVWIFNSLKDVITCGALYDTRNGEFYYGVSLSEDDFPAYFEAVRNDYRVVAPDAFNHPATSCFDEAYFVPNDIRSLLDVVVVDQKEQVGVLCCEHCGEIKNWTEDEIAYMESIAALLSFAFKTAR